MSEQDDLRVYVSGYYDIPKHQIAEVRLAMQENVRLSRAEPGNVSYEVRDDEDVEGRVHLIEVWKDRQALDEHIARVKDSPWAGISKDVTRTFDIKSGGRVIRY